MLEIFKSSLGRAKFLVELQSPIIFQGFPHIFKND